MDNKVSRLYGVYAIPHTGLIDQEGVIQATGLRGEDLSDKVGNLLEKLVNDKQKKTSGN